MIIPGGVIIAVVWWIVTGCPYNFIHREITFCCGQGSVFVDCIIGISVVIISYLTGLIIHAIAEIIFSKFRNKPNYIEKQLEDVQKTNGDINLRRFLSVNRHLDISSKYILAYCKLMEQKKLGSIPIIESQVALLRNLIVSFWVCLIIFLFIGICGCCECLPSNPCISFCQYIIAAFGFITGGGILYVVMIQRQNKIYRYIWESVNYYDI